MSYLKLKFSIHSFTLHFIKISLSLSLSDEVEISKTWPLTRESLRSTVSGVDVGNLVF